MATQLPKFTESELTSTDMDDLKVYTPSEVPDAPFPLEGEATFATTGSTSNETYTPRETKDQSFPDPRIAYEIIGRSLNTRSKKIMANFEFTKSGALQIGEYTPGVNGDIKISPNGIVARNSLGNETLAIDGETGDAVFAGTIQTGTIISGTVIVGDNTWVITGDPDNPRMLLYNNGIPEILIGRRA